MDLKQRRKYYLAMSAMKVVGAIEWFASSVLDDQPTGESIEAYKFYLERHAEFIQFVYEGLTESEGLGDKGGEEGERAPSDSESLSEKKA